MDQLTLDRINGEPKLINRPDRVEVEEEGNQRQGKTINVYKLNKNTCKEGD